MSRFLLIGSFSGGNAGDSLVLRSTIAAIEDHLPGPHHYIVPTSHPEFVRRFLSHPRVEPVDIGLRRARTYRFFGLPVLRQLKRVDAIISTAGIFFDYRLLDPRYNFIMSLLPVLWIARRFGIPSVAMNVGVAPPTSWIGRAALRGSLRAQTHIAVRDRDSFQIASRLAPDVSLSCAADTAHLLLVDRQRERRGEFLGVNLAGYLDRFVDGGGSAGGGEESLLDVLARQIGEAGTDLGRPALFLSTSRLDHQLHVRLAARVGSSVIPPVELYAMDADEMIAAFDDVDVFIGTRMHACILSTSLGIPTLALAYHPKVRSYMNEIGQPEWVLDLSLEAVGESAVRERVTRLESRWSEVRQALLQAANERAVLAAESFSALRNVIG